LINDHLPGHSPEIVKTGKQVANDLFGIKGMVLESDVAVAAGRKQGSEDEKLKTAWQAVLAKIKLHLFPEGQFRNLAIDPDGFI
jgi:hypothetical protein